MATNNTVTVSYFSDILCIWAYIAQIRLDQLRKQFPDRATINCHYLSVFGDTATKIGSGWQDRGGYQGYHDHLQTLTEQYDHISIHPDLWLRDQPPSSQGCHLFLKAIQLLQHDGLIPDPSGPQNSNRSLLEEAAWRFRLAFFRDGLNIARHENQLAIAEQLNLPVDEIGKRIDDGSAFAALSADNAMCNQYRIHGSPTFVLNEGRQILYGNIGYRIIEANIQELLEHPHNRASWC